jgi:hypothetical protein
MQGSAPHPGNISFCRQKETFHKEKPLNTYGFKNSLSVSQPPLGAARPVPFIFFAVGLANLPSPHCPYIEVILK